MTLYASAGKIAAPLSFAVGFLSLSQEIIWVRWFSFGHGGSAQSFSWVLTAFLVGIALGSLVGRRRCARSSDLRFDAGVTLLAATLVDAVALYAAPIAMLFMPAGFVLLFFLVALTSGIKGILFPIVHQMGATADKTKVGQSFSKVYASNIAGSTLGPLVTGFVLLNTFSAAKIYVGVGLMCLILGIFLVWPSFGQVPKLQSGLASALLIAIIVMLVGAPDPIVRVAKASAAGKEVVDLIQNRQGVVHLVDTQQPGGFTTYGGNVYDGRTGVDMRLNANRLDRAYFLATLHSAPKKVLIIGLSTGAWAKVIAGMPGIEHIDIVEINPAYVTLVKKNPDLKDLLVDSRVHLHWGDGRRWLRANSAARYDLVFQNTTFHWRAYTTLLLSQEYLLELKTHLLPGAIVAVNTTGSADIFYTTAKTFASSVRYDNFVYFSDKAIKQRLDAAEFLRSCTVSIGGLLLPAFQPEMFNTNTSSIVNTILNSALVPSDLYAEKTLAELRAPQVITDLNLLTEFRYGRLLWKKTNE
jgi:spermidine synthase